MKERRHHNNKGYRQIKNGSTHKSLQYIIRKLNLNEGGSTLSDFNNERALGKFARKEIMKWVFLTIVIGILITIIALVFKPINVAVERAVMVNSHQYKEGMAERSSVLSASLAEVENRIITASDPNIKAGLENQASAIRIQLNAIRR